MRKVLTFVVGFLAVLLLALGGFFLVAPPAEPPIAAVQPPTPSQSPRPNVGRIKVEAIEGDVEKKGRGGADWSALHSGDELSLEDMVRTGKDGSAVLSLGDQARVKVAEKSQLSVSTITEKVSRVRLEEGGLSAVVEDDTKLQVEMRGTDAVAEAERGEFSVLTDGKGEVAVASTKGTVRLSASDGSVEIAAGEQSVVVGSAAPSAPARIPPALFLKLGRLKTVTQRERETVVRGTTTPGALVSVNGVRAAVTRDGEFEVPIALAEGPNKLEVEVVDVLGRSERGDLPVITVDSKVGAVKTQVTW